MRFTWCWSLFGFLLGQPVLSTFEADIVRPFIRRNNVAKGESDVQNELLSKAVPLKEFEAHLAVQGLRLGRGLEDQADNNENDDDDYYSNNDEMYSFSGYSIKYAKCQPVQYFSEAAIKAGEHSPMITQDIVILRLCPQKSCTSSQTYGCHYNFAEYAITISDYVRIMLRYSAQKRSYMCSWCDDCVGNGRRRKLDDAEEEEEAEDQEDDQIAEEEEDEEEEEQEDEDEEEEEQEDEDEEDDEEVEEQEQQAQQAAQNDDYYGYPDDDGNNVNGQGDDYNMYYQDDGYQAADYYGYEYQYVCDGFSDYCYDYNTECFNGDDDTYLDYEGYLDYLDCSKVEYNGYAYFVRPRCDGYKGTIKMAVYYDNYCVQYAGNDVSLKNFGLGFHESTFEDFYSGNCIDCSESDYPPYFDAGSMLCNRLHQKGASCSSDLLYDLFEGDDDDTTQESTQCSYIESLRFGTYDEEGTLSTDTSAASWEAEVTVAQEILLGVSIAFCVIFIIYSCYLHHAMTNLLIKSLSHRELLPPSRHLSRRSPKPRRSGRRLKKMDEKGNPDWDGPEGVEA